MTCGTGECAARVAKVRAIRTGRERNMKTAVLVIDVQQGLCSGEYAAFDVARVIERINQVTEKARAAGAPVLLIQHESAEGLLARDSAGWQLAAGLHCADSDLRMAKTATDAFRRTPLDAQLRARQVDHLVICGLQSDFCVDTTTRRALALGYPVTLVADGHSTVDNGVLSAAQISAHHNVTLSNISSFGPRARAVPAAGISFS